MIATIWILVLVCAKLFIVASDLNVVISTYFMGLKVLQQERIYIFYILIFSVHDYAQECSLLDMYLLMLYTSKRRRS